ncbi:hypothetical protein D3C75_1228740 [compost metagenome]
MPGTNCPVSATITSGRLMLNSACQLNAGRVQTGVAKPTTSAELFNSPLKTAMLTPHTSTANTA